LYWKNAGFQASVGEFPQELLLIHAVLEGFAPIDENHGHLIIELPAKLRVGIDINLLPSKAAPAREFEKALFDNFAKVTSFAGVDDHASRL
jgi:hypothetical protein